VAATARGHVGLTRMAVAEPVQAHVDAAWDVALPPCPDHRVGLRRGRAEATARWRCAQGDMDCAVGDYSSVGPATSQNRLTHPRAGPAEPSRRVRRDRTTAIALADVPELGHADGRSDPGVVLCGLSAARPRRRGVQTADYALVGAQCAVPEREAPTILFCASVSE